jgi:hypothetical protein
MSLRNLNKACNEYSLNYLNILSNNQLKSKLSGRIEFSFKGLIAARGWQWETERNDKIPTIVWGEYYLQSKDFTDLQHLTMFQLLCWFLIIKVY